MIITDNTKVIETLNTLLAKEAYISIDRKDIDKMFPDISQLHLINVAGSDERALIQAFNEDYTALQNKPKAAAEFFLSQSLTMSGLEALNEGIPAPDVYKRAILFETSSAGAIDFYYFYL